MTGYRPRQKALLGALLGLRRWRHDRFFVFGCIWERGARISLLSRSLRYYQVGEGNKARLLHRNTGDRTSFIGSEISNRKDLCNELFSRLGLPVVKQLHAPTEELAVQAARQIGFPVVIKPIDSGMGRGVATDLNEAQIKDIVAGDFADHMVTVAVKQEDDPNVIKKIPVMFSHKENTGDHPKR